MTGSPAYPKTQDLAATVGHDVPCGRCGILPIERLGGWLPLTLIIGLKSIIRGQLCERCGQALQEFWEQGRPHVPATEEERSAYIAARRAQLARDLPKPPPPPVPRRKLVRPGTPVEPTMAPPPSSFDQARLDRAKALRERFALPEPDPGRVGTSPRRRRSKTTAEALDLLWKEPTAEEKAFIELQKQQPIGDLTVEEVKQLVKDGNMKPVLEDDGLVSFHLSPKGWRNARRIHEWLWARRQATSLEEKAKGPTIH